MKTAIADVLPQLARDPDLYAIAYRTTSSRAFCAGGDIRELTALARTDMSAARASLAAEYSLNWLLDCFSKPCVALLEGAVMGSGVGLSQFCTHRVAAETYKFAMPETAVGFFPDVGMAHVLAALPDEIGTYLALTGRTIGRADAYHLGLVTHCINAVRFDDIVEALSDAQPIDPLLDEVHQAPGDGDLALHCELIGRAFDGQTVEQVLTNLSNEQDHHHDPQWVAGVIDDLTKRSPTALKVTLRHLREQRNGDLRSNLMSDNRLACHFLGQPDFYEGVRAVLVDKDNNPMWQPGRLEDVLDETVQAFFTATSDDNLELPTRDEMQAARV